ncbi:MAG: hypothetical protein LBP20_00270 [Treponema sp.]|nr:hypothetical protein [Treponema sp.]
MNRSLPVSGNGRRYFEAAVLGNGKPRRFIPLVKKLGGGFIALHFLVIALALNFPVMFAIARLEPWDFYSRLYGDQFAEMLQAELNAVPEGAPALAFNQALYGEGYGRQVMLPMLGFAFMLILILQLVFYVCAAFFLGLSRLNSSPLSWRDRFGILVFSSTLPAAASALLGLWLPTVHLLVFYLAEIILVFALSRPREEG